MHTYRFGRKLKLPATIAIKHQIRKLIFEDLVKEAEVIARAECNSPIIVAKKLDRSSNHMKFSCLSAGCAITPHLESTKVQQRQSPRQVRLMKA
jgi:hypothetical protein